MILSDSTTDMTTIRSFGCFGRVRIGFLRDVVNMIRERLNRGVKVRVGWVKDLIGIEGNEMADAFAGVVATRDMELR